MSPTTPTAARQSQERGPDSLNYQRSGRNMEAIGGSYPFEEQTVACHRIVNAGSGKNQTIIAPEGRNHDCCCHAHRTGTTENAIHHGHGDAIVRRMLDFRER